MKIKIRPYGWLNLLHVLVTILAISACLALPAYHFNLGKLDVFDIVLFPLAYPLLVHLVKTYNRYILLTEDKIAFQIDYEKTGIFRWPKFYQDEFNLQDLKFYGIFSAPYIRGYTKAPRGKKADRSATNKQYDILEVKEGKLKIPLGAITVGNPLVFAWQKTQYVLDDYLFTKQQYAALFRHLENSTKIAPSGAVKSLVAGEKRSGLSVSLLLLLAVVSALALPFVFIFLVQLTTDLTFNLSFQDYKTTAFLTFFILGNYSLVTKLYCRFNKGQDFKTFDTIEFVANICLAIFYLAAVIIFIVSYII